MLNLQFSNTLNSTGQVAVLLGMTTEEDDSLQSPSSLTSNCPVQQTLNQPGSISVSHPSTSKHTRLTSFSKPRPKITIDDIPDELLILISKQIKDELTEKVKEELNRIREESRREIDKIRHDLLSENEFEIQRRVREEFDKLVKHELEKQVKIRLEEQQEFWNSEFKRQTSQWVSFFCQNNQLTNIGSEEPKLDMTQMNSKPTSPQTESLHLKASTSPAIHSYQPETPNYPDISVLDIPSLNHPYSISNDNKENEYSAPRTNGNNNDNYKKTVNNQEATKKTTTIPTVTKKAKKPLIHSKASNPPMSNEQIEKDYSNKKKQIDQWIQAEQNFESSYREQRQIIEEFFSHIVNDASVVGQMHLVSNRMFNGLSWIFSNWEALEVSFKHRNDFVSTSVVRNMLVDEELMLTEYNIPVIESELSRECRFISNLLNVKEVVEQVSKREEMKIRLNTIALTLSQGNSTPSQSKKLILEKNKKASELLQLTEKLEHQIDQAEKNGEQILYRGLRYKDLLGFDKLKKDYEGLKDSENEMKKWASRYAKKFS